jgi:hypothetical protein
MMNMFEMAIEKSRNRMIQLAFRHGFAAKETVKASQHLDQLLNLIQKREKNNEETA